MPRTEPLRIGIVGANPERGWASRAHLPAVQALPGVELTAVATTRRESARAAAERFGARHAFADPFELIACPDVEAVTVAVRVPHHAELVRAALAAGKHVYCEWPLGRATHEAQELRDLAAAQGVRTVVGLQARRAGAIRHARDLLLDGWVGRVLSATLRVAAGLGGHRYPAELAWLADRANGTNLLTVTAGHALDTLAALVGEPRELSATVATRVTVSQVVETGAPLAVTSPDQIAIAGVGEDGVVIAAHVQGGMRAHPGFVLEIRGDEGLLEISSRPALTSARFELRGARGDDAEPATLDVRAGYGAATRAVSAAVPASVAELYVDLATAVREGRAVGPDFDHALRRHRMLDAIVAAADSGTRQVL